MRGPEQGQRAAATAAHRSSWAVPAAALGLVTVALAGASLLWADGPGWRATPAAIRSMVAVDMGAVSRDPGHPASNGLARVRGVRCWAMTCAVDYNADHTGRLHTPGQLERQMEPIVAGMFRDPSLTAVDLIAWGPAATGQSRLFEVECTRADVSGLDLPHVSAARLAASCGYVAYSQT
jgi:hypothetical protein